MKILSFDIESATGSPIDGSLCSFGYCLAEDYKIIEQGDILVNPKPTKFRLGKKGEEPKIKLAYPEEVFRSSPRFNQVYEKIKSLFTPDVVCIGFAITNDVKYLNNACYTYKLEPIEYKFFDVQMLLGFFDEENTGLGLGKMGEKYSIAFTEHKSEDDAVVTYKLLMMICEKTGKTVEELLEYYEIALGENNKNGVINCYSLAQLHNKKGLKRSKAQGGILLHEFLKQQNQRKKVFGKLTGKRFCFNSSLESDDINFSRKLINQIYLDGGRYTGDLTVANVYVKSNSEEEDNRLKKVRYEISKGRKIKIITQEKFLSLFDTIADIEFHDVSVLVKHAKEKQLNKLKRNKK